MKNHSCAKRTHSSQMQTSAKSSLGFRRGLVEFRGPWVGFSVPYQVSCGAVIFWTVALTFFHTHIFKKHQTAIEMLVLNSFRVLCRQDEILDGNSNEMEMCSTLRCSVARR